MSVTTNNEELPQENVVDNLTPVDNDKLAALKAKMNKKDDMPPKIVRPRKRSLNFGVVGTGQGGSRLAEEFFKLGYDTVVFNTAAQDLEHIQIPEDNKLLLSYGLGGAAKELEIGKAAAETHRSAINELVELRLGKTDVFVLALSLGGGSGAGSCETMVDILSEAGKPIVVIAVLPMDSDDAQTKHNSLETLAKIAKFTQSKKVQNIILVDNAKIESIFADVSQLDFYSVANRAIVEPIDAFNTLSSHPSPSKPLDNNEWAKLLLDGEGLSVFGSLKVSNYQDETAIAEAIMRNLDSNLLAGGFDLKQSKYVGYMLVASKAVWDKIPSSSVTFANHLIMEQAGTPKATFRGIYVIDDPEDCVKVYSVFAGLSLPVSRIDSLKKDAQSQMQRAKSKDESRTLNLQLDTGINDAISAAQKVKDKIAAKASSFSKFLSSTLDKHNK